MLSSDLSCQLEVFNKNKSSIKILTPNSRYMQITL